MKQMILPSAIIIGFIAFFLMIDHKEINRNNKVQTVQSESPSTNRKRLASAVPETKPTELKPAAETRPVVETKPVENRLNTDTRPSEKKQADTKNVVVIRQKDSPAPIALPVATEEEAEKLNEEAIEYTKSTPLKNRTQHIKKGYKTIINGKPKRFQTVRPTSKQEMDLSSKGYDLEDLKRRQIPYKWALDIDNLPKAASFYNTSIGYRLESEKGNIRLFTEPFYDNMRSSFLAEIIVKNESQECECEIELGVQGSGTIKNGYSLIKKESLAPGQETMLQWEISVYDCYYMIRPAISINGIATLKEYNLYRYDHKEITLVEGEIAARSLLPDPQTTDYPDCRYTAQFIGNSIVSGSPCNKEIVLSVDGFIDKKVLPSNQLKQKDKIKCAIVPFDSVPEELSGTQEADTLSLFELDSYLLLSYRKIGSFSDYSETNSGVTFKDDDSVNKEYISILKKQINPVLSEEEKKAQKESIANDLTKIDQLLLPYSDEKKQKINADFNVAWDKEKAKDSSGTTNRIGKNVWRNMDNSFYTLPESYVIINSYPEISQHNLKALVALKEYLELQGVQLIISLVPHFYDISARVINHDFSSIPDFRTAYVVKQLLENRIEAIYASDDIIANYNKYETSFFYPSDGHPGDLPQDILSDKIAERLSRFRISRQMNREDFQSVKEDYYSSWMALSSFSFPENCDIGKHQPGDFYSVNRIRYRNQTISNDPNAQILVLGNSYSNVPEPISKYLCMKLGVEIYHYSVAGNGILLTAIQRLFNNPEAFLKNKKVLILSIGTVHLTDNITIPNIRELDSDAERLYNSKLLNNVEFQGRETSIPEFALLLDNPAIFKTDEDGVYTLFDDSDNLIPSMAPPDERYFLVIHYSFVSSSPFELVTNDSSYPLIGSQQYPPVWFKQIIPVTHNKDFVLKMVGKPNTFFAIGTVQLYQQ